MVLVGCGSHGVWVSWGVVLMERGSDAVFLQVLILSARLSQQYDTSRPRAGDDWGLEYYSCILFTSYSKNRVHAALSHLKFLYWVKNVKRK